MSPLPSDSGESCCLHPPQSFTIVLLTSAKYSCYSLQVTLSETHLPHPTSIDTTPTSSSSSSTTTSISCITASASASESASPLDAPLQAPPALHLNPYYNIYQITNNNPPHPIIPPPPPNHVHPKKEKRPSLTHFLCLPLINTTSLPQLESSLATFKSSIPLLPPPDTTTHHSLRPLPQPQPLIPASAHRPVGTLHLTLGVMSLPTPDRLSQALDFLQSLDLVSMLRDSTSTLASDKQEPLIISLKSLHALPRPKAATVLHASPVDPTSRLYPFCVKLRDAFLDAGFLVPEARKRKLLLHATVVNTIYAKGKGVSAPRSRGKGFAGGGGGGGKRKEQYSFDARGLIAKYRGQTLGVEGESGVGDIVGEGDGVSGSGSEDGEGSQVGGEGNGDEEKAFVWARDFPIEAVAICEMGAKKLEPDLGGQDGGMNARLGEKYRVVGEKSLLF
ncbi:hypothetical protein BO94DRAFT_624438 [Aspergillus sclerotioniger CBS 115572]|uniref:A-kinase anchor protein 7-like phosphoesterase domain-containing protein n=1 Tax=Aspergillus sclerotioniger CBS 115572 TaxID=1450535 RepID=A0A317WLA5_9EURO|nr:hypothetical protein BO94DRAFT_624438 [Aspergillus sclerotioniger CBS 115572]PWY87264.1 hypothetical protein BO94DRAFT_624438 [Aspergillus sclerotioniger CBS 115572]